MTAIEITPEVIAFARAVIAQVGPATRTEDRFLFNVRTGIIHNPTCRSRGGTLPMTKDEIWAAHEWPEGCKVCGTGGDHAREIPFDTTVVAIIR